MLSSAELVAALKRPKESPEKLSIIPSPILTELEERGGTSIDLRLGRWFRSFKQSQTTAAQLINRGNGASEPLKSSEHFVPFGSEFVLHPGRFVLGVSLEWIRLPKTLSGYVTGKSSLGRHGLVIETAAGIHPSFSGCLTLELANVGEVPLAIYPGMKICQIFLHRIAGADQQSPGQMSGRRKPSLPSIEPDVVLEKLAKP